MLRDVPVAPAERVGDGDQAEQFVGALLDHGSHESIPFRRVHDAAEGIHGAGLRVGDQ